jgi:hypothetical protein
MLYHIWPLYNARYIEVLDYDGDSKFPTYLPTRLTWNGHDFLDSARNENIWNKAKEIVIQNGGSIAMESLKALLLKLSMSALGLNNP